MWKSTFLHFFAWVPTIVCSRALCHLRAMAIMARAKHSCVIKTTMIVAFPTVLPTLASIWCDANLSSLLLHAVVHRKVTCALTSPCLASPLHRRSSCCYLPIAHASPWQNNEPFLSACLYNDLGAPVSVILDDELILKNVLHD